jgi:hypothetical protein
MSEVVIQIDECIDERFFAAIKEARGKGRVVSFDMQRNMRPEYRGFVLRGFLSFGGTARIVIDVDDGLDEDPLFV